MSNPNSDVLLNLSSTFSISKLYVNYLFSNDGSCGDWDFIKRNSVDPIAILIYQPQSKFTFVLKLLI